MESKKIKWLRYVTLFFLGFSLLSAATTKFVKWTSLSDYWIAEGQELVCATPDIVARQESPKTQYIAGWTSIKCPTSSWYLPLSLSTFILCALSLFLAYIYLVLRIYQRLVATQKTWIRVIYDTFMICLFPVVMIMFSIFSFIYYFSG